MYLYQNFLVYHTDPNNFVKEQFGKMWRVNMRDFCC